MVITKTKTYTFHKFLPENIYELWLSLCRWMPEGRCCLHIKIPRVFQTFEPMLQKLRLLLHSPNLITVLMDRLFFSFVTNFCLTTGQQVFVHHDDKYDYHYCTFVL